MVSPPSANASRERARAGSSPPPPSSAPLPPVPDSNAGVASIRRPPAGEGPAVPVHRFDPDSTPEEKAKQAKQTSESLSDQTTSIPEGGTPASTSSPAAKMWAALKQNGAASQAASPLSPDSGKSNGGDGGGIRSSGGGGSITGIIGDKKSTPSEAFSNTVHILMNAKRQARRMRYKTSKETGIVRLPARAGAVPTGAPPPQTPLYPADNYSHVKTGPPGTTAKDQAASSGSSEEGREGEGEGEGASHEPKGLYGWKEVGTAQAGDKPFTLEGIWALIEQFDRWGLWRNCAGFFALMFFMYLITNLGFGLFGFLVVTSFGVQWYNNSIRRFRHAYRDDLKRAMEASEMVKSMESAGWMNEFLSRFWLIYEPVLSATVVQIADVILEQATPGFIDSIRLTEFTLGTKAPRIEGIKTYNEIQDDDVIVMDWDASFTPNDIQDIPFRLLADKVNPKVVLTVRVGKGFVGAGLPIMVEDMVFRGKMQVRLHLMKRFPHIKTADVCFVKQPMIDFVLKPVGGDTFGMDIAHIPVLQKFILDLVHSNMAPMFYAPNHFTVDVDQLLNGTVTQIDSAIGVLVVTLHYARNLPKVDTFGSADPYVVAYVTSKPEQYAKTQIKEDTLNPTWNETKVILVYSSDENLQLDIYDWNNVGKDEKLGIVTIPVKDFEDEPEQEGVNRPIFLRDKENGRINFDVSYFPVIEKSAVDVEVSHVEDGEAANLALAPTEVESNTGLLQLYVRSAKDLAMTKTAAKKLNVHVVSFVNKDMVMESPAVKKTDEPVWEQGKEVFVADREQSKLTFKVMDGERRIGVVRIDLNTALERQKQQQGLDWYPIEGHVKAKLRIFVKWRPVLMDADIAAVLGQGKKLVPPPIGVVKINMWEGRNIKNVETLQGTKSDPYVRVMVQNRVVTSTRWIANNLNPVWNETLFVPVHRVQQTIVLECMDYNQNERDKPLGEFVFQLKQLLGLEITLEDGEKAYEKGKPLELWAGLKQRNGKFKGEIRFRAMFIPVINFDGDLEEEGTVSANGFAKPHHPGVSTSSGASSSSGHHPNGGGENNDRSTPMRLRQPVDLNDIFSEDECEARPMPNGADAKKPAKVETSVSFKRPVVDGDDKPRQGSDGATSKSHREPSSVSSSSSEGGSSSGNDYESAHMPNSPLEPDKKRDLPTRAVDSIFSGVSGQTQNTASALRRYPRLPNIDFSEFEAGVLTFYLVGCQGLRQSFSGVYAVVTANNDAQESLIETEVSGRRGNEHIWEDEKIAQISVIEARYNKIKIEVLKKEVGGSKPGFIGRTEISMLELLKNRLVNTAAPVTLPLDDGLGEVIAMFRYDPVEDPELTSDESITNMGELRIRLISGSNLPAVDRSGTSDPYVVLQVNGEVVWKSDVIKETLNPKWNQQAILYVRNRNNTALTVEVFDWNKIQSNELLGTVDIPLGLIPIEAPLCKDYMLDNRGQASLRLEFMFIPQFIQQHDDSRPVLSSIAHSFTHAPVNVVKGGTRLAGNVIGGGFHVATGAVGGLFGKIRGKDRKKTGLSMEAELSPAATEGLATATNMPAEPLRTTENAGSSTSLHIPNDNKHPTSAGSAKPFSAVSADQIKGISSTNPLAIPHEVPKLGKFEAFPLPGSLIIRIIEAKLGGERTSSYVTVSLSGKTVYETRAKKDSNPYWDETFKCPTLAGFKPEIGLSIKHSRIGKDKVLFNVPDIDVLSIIGKGMRESHGTRSDAESVWLEDSGTSLHISVAFEARTGEDGGAPNSATSWDQKSIGSNDTATGAQHSPGGKRSSRRRVSSLAGKIAGGFHH